MWDSTNRSYPLKRSKGKKRQEPPHSYSSSLVIYTSRRDDTTTEDSDVTSASASTSNASKQNDNDIPKQNRQPASLPTQELLSLRHEGSLQARHAAMPSSDYASLSDIPHPEDLKRREDPERKISGSSLYEPVRQPERIFKVLFLIVIIFYSYYFISGSSCSTAVEHSSHDKEDVGPYPARCWAFLSSLSYQQCVINLCLS